jgi:hypothetical protein
LHYSFSLFSFHHNFLHCVYLLHPMDPSWYQVYIVLLFRVVGCLVWHRLSLR